MGTDYIPPSDADFDAWLTNFVDYVVANAVALGATPAQVTSLQTVKTDWDAKYPASTTAQASAASAVQAKSDSRSATEDLVRPFVAMLQSNSGVTDAQRQSMGITVRSGARTPVGPPSSKPIASIDTSQRLRHTISFVDELTPTSRAKPDGVQGCEIWMKVGDPSPGGPNDVHYLALDTRTPYVTDFEAADAGKTAYYMLRWLSTRGETGPWSQTVSGTITN
jgi:hypothetical protein